MCGFCNATPDKMRAYGKQFGYPDCCVEEFVKDAATIDAGGEDPRNAIQVEVGEHTGFVPCKACAAKITSVNDVFKLITNRDTTIPRFPHV